MIYLKVINTIFLSFFEIYFIFLKFLNYFTFKLLAISKSIAVWSPKYFLSFYLSLLKGFINRFGKLFRLKYFLKESNEQVMSISLDK